MKTDRIRKEVLKYSEISFNIEIKTNLKVVDFLDITFNLSNGTYKPYRKPNDNLLYVNTSNHVTEIIKHLPTPKPKRLSKNLSSIQIFNSVKVEYENASENSGYNSIKLNYTQTRKNKLKHNRSQNIILFNPPYSQNVITN